MSGVILSPPLVLLLSMRLSRVIVGIYSVKGVHHGYLLPCSNSHITDFMVYILLLPMIY
jgi:hypothetical protein